MCYSSHIRNYNSTSSSEITARYALQFLTLSTYTDTVLKYHNDMFVLEFWHLLWGYLDRWVLWDMDDVLVLSPVPLWFCWYIGFTQLYTSRWQQHLMYSFHVLMPVLLMQCSIEIHPIPLWEQEMSLVVLCTEYFTADIQIMWFCQWLGHVTSGTTRQNNTKWPQITEKKRLAGERFFCCNIHHAKKWEN